MGEYVHEEKYKGFVITLEQDDNPEDPRSWDNLGMMVCTHQRYNLGDYMLERGWVLKSRRNESVPFYNSIDGFKDWISHMSKLGKILCLPLYLYDHSGITMQTRPFGDPWDSGQVGYIYVTKDAVLKEYGWKYLTQPRIKRILAYLQQEVITYDQYLTGDVVGWQVWRDHAGGELLESVWGYYGKAGELQAIQEAKDAIDYEIRQEIKINGQQLSLPGFEGYLPEEVQLERERLDTLTDTGG